MITIDYALPEQLAAEASRSDHLQYESHPAVRLRNLAILTCLSTLDILDELRVFSLGEIVEIYNNCYQNQLGQLRLILSELGIDIDNIRAEVERRQRQTE